MKRFLSLIAGVLLGLTACGLPAEDEPHAVDLPRQPLTAPLPSGPPVHAGAFAEILCLVRDGRLVQTVRRIDEPPGVPAQLDHLVAGPDQAERATGLTSALTGLSLRATQSPGGSEARVEVAETDESTAITDDSLTYGQIVCTLTSRTDVASVVFTRGGRRLQVPRADGSLSREPLTAGDYATLLISA